jgi:cysteine desulfurase/selenocysteine lyase
MMSVAIYPSPPLVSELKPGAGDLESVNGWRAYFPITETHIYLDHAGVGPLPQGAVDAVTASLVSQARYGSLIHEDLFGVAEILRKEMASLLGVRSQSLAAVGSTSAGISLVAMGLDWRPGDNVVIADVDFPSIVFPWMVLANQGVEVRRVTCQKGCIDAREMLATANERTRVIAVSWVQFSSGYRVDLKELGDACHRRGILLIVDGMQGAGAIPIDLSSLPVDAFATQSYKWLLSPHGLGWLYLRDELLEHLRLSGAGMRTVSPRESYLDHRFELRRDAQRFESGIMNFHCMAGAVASVRLLRAIGIEKIGSRLAALSNQLAGGLRALGCNVLGRPGDPLHGSGIVVFAHPWISPRDCHRRLMDANIVTSVRGNGVRVSPHFYNTEGEIDDLLSVLAEC